jgi:hypothetical protein
MVKIQSASQLQYRGQGQQYDGYPPGSPFPAPKAASDTEQAKPTQIHADPAVLGKIDRQELLQPFENTRFLRKKGLENPDQPNGRNEPGNQVDPALRATKFSLGFLARFHFKSSMKIAACATSPPLHRQPISPDLESN